MKMKHYEENWTKVDGYLILKTKENKIYRVVQREHKLGLVQGYELFCEPEDSKYKTFSIFDVNFQRL